MKLTVSTLPRDGLPIHDNIPLDALNARMSEGRENDIEFLESPTVDLMVTKTGGGAQVKGTIQTKYRQPCARCLDQFDFPLNLEVDFILARRPSSDDLQEGEDVKQYEDDVGIFYYDGDHYELEDAIQELLILNLERFWRPEVDDSGCCRRCGRNMETAQEKGPETVSLGALLSAAMKKR